MRRSKYVLSMLAVGVVSILFTGCDYNAHNTDPIGMINTWTNLNAGVRCVRAF